MGSRRTTSHRLFAGALILVIALLVFFEPQYGWKLRAWLTPVNPTGSAQGGTQNGAQADSPNLAAQNDALRAQLAQLQSVANALPSVPANYIRAMVYSRYPFDFKNEIVVNAGTDQGVAVGAAVIFQNMLIGTIQKVFPDSSEIQTVFDDDMKMPVRIGAGAYDGLLQGGSYPQVDSIAKDSPLAAGDIVYAAAQGIPYGLPLGTVESTSTSADSLFEQAALNFPYDVNAIQTVLIAK